jgi:hypothetical protein
VCAVAIVGKSWVVLFGEIVAVCCGNCRGQLSEAFVEICGLKVKYVERKV